MMTTEHIQPRGPALLAQAGVTLGDALWLYRVQRGAGSQDLARLEPIRRKVYAFLARHAARRRCARHRPEKSARAP